MKALAQATKGQSGEQLLAALLERVRRVFYKDTIGVPPIAQRPFFQDRSMLIRGLCHPAEFMVQKQWPRLSAEKYESMICTVLRTISEHGVPAAAMRRRGAYIVHCLQEHWRINWDQYYETAKANDLAADTLKSLSPKVAAPGAAPHPIDYLAAVAREALAVKGAGRKPKPKLLAPKPREIQSELF